MDMKSAKEDGGDCWKQWYRTHHANLLRLSGAPPANLCLDQLNLTVCCRYAEVLLGRKRIQKYLAKHHAAELSRLVRLVEDFERVRQS